MKWTVLEKKVKELTGDHQKVLLAQMTQLVEDHITVVEMRAPKIQTETRGSPLGSRNLPKSSTKRDLSKFEHMDQVESLKKRKCGCCGKVGHNKRTCLLSHIN